MKTIGLTGSSGFVGSKLSALKGKGYETVESNVDWHYDSLIQNL